MRLQGASSLCSQAKIGEQNLVTDGNFDNANNFVLLDPPFGWTDSASGAGSNFVDPNFYASAPYGFTFGDANPATLSQTLATTTGQCYVRRGSLHLRL